ncbi:MAG: AAA family ATPase [Actinobacteria bacterium]|nr:AAA family ATPase [Actinomycetota bacterium]
MSAPTVAVIADTDELPTAVAAAVPAGVTVRRYAELDDLGESAPDVLVAGPPCRRPSALPLLAGFHELFPATGIVLAFDRPHVNVRDLVWIGADALVDPTSPEEVAVAVRRSLEIARTRGAAAPTAVEDTLGRVLTVCSATGGCGKTFYATNLASFLSRWSGRRVALVDLDLQFGEITTALQLRVRHTIVDALTDDVDNLGDHIGELLTPHASGVSVLAAPRAPGEADRVTPAEVARIIEALRRSYDYVVVDTPTGLGEPVLAAMDVSERLFALASLDLPSVRNLRLFLQTLERLDIPDEHVSLVLNKAQRGLGVEVDEVVRLFPQGFRSILPFAAEVPRSMNRGTPVLDSDPHTEISRQLVAGISDLLPDDARGRLETELAAGSSRSFLSRLGLRGRRDHAPDARVPAGAVAGGVDA